MIFPLHSVVMILVDTVEYEKNKLAMNNVDYEYNKCAMDNFYKSDGFFKSE